MLHDTYYFISSRQSVMGSLEALSSLALLALGTAVNTMCYWIVVLVSTDLDKYIK